MQKMICVSTRNDVEELNALFEEGWHLVKMVAAGGGSDDSWGTDCFVVIEKDTEQN